MHYQKFTALKKKFYDLKLTDTGEITQPTSIQPTTAEANNGNRGKEEENETLASAFPACTGKAGECEISVSRGQDFAKQSCLFCDKNAKKFRGKLVYLHSTGKEIIEKNILRHLKLGTNQFKDIIDKLRNTADDNIYYHKTCQIKFNNKKRDFNKNPVRSSWHTSRENHQLIFEEISTLVEENVIKRGRC